MSKDPELSGDETPIISGTVAETNANHPIAEFARYPSATAVMQVLTDSAEPIGVSTICELADISRPTWYDIRDMLVDFGMIEEARRANGGPLYRARTDNDVVQAWHRFRLELAHEATS